jgi:hypothetical protein
VQVGWIFKRASLHGTEYWRGRMNGFGDPVTSLHVCDAFVFRSHDGALQTAETHAALRDSDQWRVVRR